MLVLFDIDGTLLMGNGVGRVATHAAMLDVFGTTGRLDEHKFAGKTDWYTLLELLGAEGFAPADVERLMPDYERALAHHMAQAVTDRQVTALPGAHDAVSALREDSRFLLGIVTGNLYTTAPIKLRAAGFDPDWFPIGAYGSEAIDRNDLPPLAMQRATAHNGRSYGPQDVVIIGDTLMDIACARAVGARIIAVATGFSTRAELAAAAPDHLLDSLEDLLPLLL
jgi:phosphoglycolate phosphatase-like HAD superfamily hydrolase